MALDARHSSGIFLHHQMLSSRDVATNNVQNSGQVSLNHPTPYGTAAATNPRYGNIPVNNNNTNMNSGSVAYPADTRKRLRDYGVDDFRGSRNPFLSGGHSSFQIPQQQFDIDRFISENAERMRIGIEEHRQRCFRLAIEAAELVVREKLKSKEEELVNIVRRNKALQDRVEALTVDNQMWRRLAQMNEATTNALRRDLEQAVAERQQLLAAAGEDDALSHCGSNNCELDPAAAGRGKRVCRRCEREESCVLLLPCRHLCLCAACGSSTHACPVCNSIRTGSLHVNV